MNDPKSFDLLESRFLRLRLAARAEPNPPLELRLRRLRALDRLLRENAEALAEAVSRDFGHRSPAETRLLELFPSYEAIADALGNLRGWMRPQRRRVSLWFQPASAEVRFQPLGAVGIIVPWNYPIYLAVGPLVAALAAGNRALIKMSEFTPATASLFAELIAAHFAEDEVAVVQGDAGVAHAFSQLPFDHLLFTGSTPVGHHVMRAAAENLTPVTIELGGKSPAIIGKKANFAKAVERIIVGKSLNAGQTCIAPDYLMIHEEIKDEFLKELEISFKKLLGADASTTVHFVRIVNDKAFERLEGYLKDGQIAFGGHTDRGDRYFEPTVLDGVSPDAPVMREEIFGPIFPVQTFKEIDEVISFVTSREKPLALYYFGSRGDYVLRHTSSGGACINDTIMHIANENIPFGGVGNSGLGSYHHKRSFDAFTHYRAVVTTPTWLDLPFRYMPYKFFKAVKRLL